MEIGDWRAQSEKNIKRLTSLIRYESRGLTRRTKAIERFRWLGGDFPTEFLRYEEISSSAPQAPSQSVELRVDWHPSGRYTLTRRDYGKRAKYDVRERGLRGNMDEVDFVRALREYIRKLQEDGCRITFAGYMVQKLGIVLR
ncbi:MAG: hypothetical protein JOZ84_16655 [Methylobacteriaceae bacterium]|nr:hypothetical protein [Methylobacteriaceae bacterium]